jgi:hypothetical protein
MRHDWSRLITFQQRNQPIKDQFQTGEKMLSFLNIGFRFFSENVGTCTEEMFLKEK